MKRKLGILISLMILVLLAVATTAGAETYTGSYGSSITWTVDTTAQTLTLAGTGEIPGSKYSASRPWDTYAKNIQTVVVGEGITKIGNSAFYKLTNMRRLEISSTVSYIAYNGDMPKWEGIYVGIFPTSSHAVKEITVAAGNPYLRMDDGVLVSSETANGAPDRVIYCPAGRTKASYALPDAITQIDEYAFRNNEYLQQVTMGNDVTYLGKYAFSGCTGLKSVTLSAGLTEIPERAFEKCESLLSITVPEGVVSLGNYAFSNCTALSNVSLPGTLTSFGSGCFSSTKNIQEVVLGEGLETIPDSLFASCTKLTKVTLPSTLKTIGERAFFNCSLADVTLPKSVTEVGEGAFAEYAYQQSPTLAAITVEAGNSAYTAVDGVLYTADMTTLVCYPAGKADISIALPDSVTNIAGYAFYWCRTLTSVDIPNGVTSIGSYAFNYATSLKSVKIPDGVISIGSGAFYGCQALTSVELPDSVIDLGGSMFYECTALESVKLPKNLTSIKAYTFYDCDALQTVTLPKGLTTLADSVFDSCNNLAAISVAEGNADFASVDGVLYSGDMSALVLCPRGRLTTTLIIPAGVSSIKENAFYTCSTLETVYLPATLTAVPRYSFYNCKALKSLYFYGSAPGEVSSAVYGSPKPTVYHLADAEGWGATWNGCTTAVWIPENTATYNVTYNANGGANAPAAATKTADVALVLSSFEPSWEGHTFLGWGLSADAETVVYQSGDRYEVNEDVELFAIWEVKTYTVRFDVNGGAGELQDMTKSHSVALTLPTEAPTRTYYTFLGWSTSASATFSTWQPGDTYSTNSDATLYAVWQAVTYTVTYDANGGADAPIPQTKNAGADLILAAAEPVRDGYEFLGWGLSANAGEAAYQPEDVYTQDADLALYALWQRIVTGNEAVVTLSSATARPGETVTLTASIANNQGLAGYLFEIRADKNVFSVGTTDGELNITPGAVSKSGTLLTNTSEAGWKVMWYHTNDVSTNGVLFTVELTVAADAPDGEYAVELVYSEDDTVDVSGTLVHFAVTGGKVTVNAGVKGDVTGDGKVSNTDVIRLARHLVGLTTMTDEQLARADANGDGKVNNSDVIKLARYLIGLTTLE